MRFTRTKISFEMAESVKSVHILRGGMYSLYMYVPGLSGGILGLVELGWRGQRGVWWIMLDASGGDILEKKKFRVTKCGCACQGIGGRANVGQVNLRCEFS